MKFTGILIAFLYLQASASFLDNFRSAVSNVERGFGKLLTDVVTDVKDTIHCTISAVENVLVLNGLLDKTSTYSYRCRDLSQPIQPTHVTPSKNRDQRSIFDYFNRLKYPSYDLNRRHSPRRISMELGNSIANVNKTINDILNRREENRNLKIVSKTMVDETNRITEISKILKRELEKLSSNIILEIKKLHLDRYESNLETVWDEFKTLHDIQQSSKNATEINEIRKILDKVVDKLYMNSDNTKVSGDYNLKEIRKNMQKYSDRNDKHIREVQHFQLQKSDTKNPPKALKLTKKIISNKKNVNDNRSNTDKSVFNLELDSFDYLTPFSQANTDKKKIINNAKKIIEDSQHTDKILNNFFKEHRSGSNVFSDPGLFDFSKS